MHPSTRPLRISAAIAAVVAAVCALTIDLPIARAVGTYEPWGGWDWGVHVLEYVAGIEPWIWTTVVVLGVGVLASLIAKRGAQAWMFVAATHLLVRNITAWAKLLTGRLRPYEWLPRGRGTWLHDGGFSFPSGHVTLFASLAIPIAVAFPRLRVPMFAVVGFVMLARVATNAHFVSDVVAAVALVCACTALWQRVIYGRQPPASHR